MNGELTLPAFKKHELYESAVQNVAGDLEFLNEQYQKVYGRRPLSLREDFGGTAALACLWTQQSDQHVACGIDLDPEPVEYGKAVHYGKLNDEEKSRMKYIMGNVLDDYDFKNDVVVAFNFSYSIFKKRKELVEYFSKVRQNLGEEGAFFIDLFGGTEARDVCVEETEDEEAGFTYFWDCDKYNPITHECFYAIHFKTHNDGKKYRNVFTYDWRLWGLAELREIMEDAGFSKTVAFWEGDDDDGTGDGEFYKTEEAENCESWVTYIMALP